MCDDKYGSPLKPPISTFELNTYGLSLNEQIKLMDLSESNDFVHEKTMRQQVLLVSKVLCDDNSRINYSTIHTHTVCVPYYKAAPYNISHTQNFSMAIFTLIFFINFFFMYVYHA